MRDRLAAFWRRLSSATPEQRPETHLKAPDDPKLAAAALMIEVARMDEAIDPEERDRVVELIRWKFTLQPAEAAALVAEAEAVTEGPAHWHRFAAILRGTMDSAERLQIVDLLWDIVYADGRLHHLETSLMRRVASLLNVSDTDSGLARQRARLRYGLSEDLVSENPQSRGV